jgi:hypothetical protein
VYGKNGPLGRGTRDYDPEDVAELRKAHDEGAYNAVRAFRGVKKKKHQGDGISIQGPITLRQGMNHGRIR